MTTARTLFPGAMGPEGFISCFDHLMDDALLRRKLILKGGPGVGKSTFMRRVHAALCANGEPSTLYFCSGDPDSLDGVAVSHAGLLILDGTAPHIVDPEIPGARDSIINLGECLNEPAHALAPVSYPRLHGRQRRLVPAVRAPVWPQPPRLRGKMPPSCKALRTRNASSA